MTHKAELNWKIIGRRKPKGVNAFCPELIRHARLFGSPSEMYLVFFRQLPDDEENSSPLTHRPFQLTKNDSPDRIRQAIRIAERELYRPSKGDSSPEWVINSVANAIEGLTERLWKEDYDKKEPLHQNLWVNSRSGS